MDNSKWNIFLTYQKAHKKRGNFGKLSKMKLKCSLALGCKSYSNCIVFPKTPTLASF